LPLHLLTSTDLCVNSCAPRSGIDGYHRCRARRFLDLGGL